MSAGILRLLLVKICSMLSPASIELAASCFSYVLVGFAPLLCRYLAAHPHMIPVPRSASSVLFEIFLNFAKPPDFGVALVEISFVLSVEVSFGVFFVVIGFCCPGPLPFIMLIISVLR